MMRNLPKYKSQAKTSSEASEETENNNSPYYRDVVLVTTEFAFKKALEDNLEIFQKLCSVVNSFKRYDDKVFLYWESLSWLSYEDEFNSLFSYFMNGHCHFPWDNFIFHLLGEDLTDHQDIGGMFNNPWNTNGYKTIQYTCNKGKEALKYFI